jgi:hypothetical protein
MNEEKTILTVVKDGGETKKEMKKPSESETEQYKNDFSTAMNAFKDKKWQISEPGKFGSNDVGLYLLDFMNKYAYWTKTEWMGMIKMESELQKAIAIADEENGLQLGYQALEFCAYMLTNPGGTGLAFAKEFEAQAEKYAKIGVVVGTKIEEARKELKDIQYLQEKWASACQGFYLSDLEPKKEEPKEEPKEETESVNIGTIEIDLSKKEEKSE